MQEKPDLHALLLALVRQNFWLSQTDIAERIEEAGELGITFREGFNSIDDVEFQLEVEAALNIDLTDEKWGQVKTFLDILELMLLPYLKADPLLQEPHKV